MTGIRLALLLATGLTTLAAQNTPDAASQIRHTRERSNQALASHDLQAFGSSLAPDFVMVRGNGVLVSSRQAYLEVVGADFRNPNAVRYQRIADQVDISSMAPVAAEHGHWIATLPNGRRAYTGTYLAMWRQMGTEWKIRSELFVVLQCEDTATCAGYRK